VSSSYLDIIEAAYEPHSPNESWVQHVTEVAYRSLEGAWAAIALHYWHDASGVFAIQAGGEAGSGPTQIGPAIEWGFRNLSPDFTRRLFAATPPAGLFRRRARELGDPAAGDKAASLLQGGDGIGINGGDGDRGTLLNVFVREEHVPKARAMASLSRVAVHLGAAGRLRRAIGALEDESGAEAVLDPGGKLLHAEEPAKSADAREALSLAARAIDKARGKLRRLDPCEAIEIWRGLVSGRWTLVDHVDRGGRRTLLARRNDLQRSDPAALSAIELQSAAFAALGYSNKLVGYAVGVPASTAATYLARAMRKLHVRSRNDLQRLLSPWLAT